MAISPRPETKYVDVGGAEVAYQVLGDGPIDIIDCYALGGHVDLFRETAREQADYLNQLAAAGRVIIFDRRGSGASDPLPLNAIPTWEELAEDLTAVLDATGSTFASIVGTVETGPIAILFAASHPERVRSLVLINTTARFMAAEDYPEGASSETIGAIVDLIAEKWGTEEFAQLVTPGLGTDEQSISAVAQMFRASATPRTAAAEYEYFMRHVDVRQVLPLIQVPTLIVHAQDSPLLPVAHGRYLAKHITGARLIEVPGGDLTPGFDLESNADVIEFLTGARPSIEIDRILTTVLFTDIAGSTERAATLGDRRWKALLDDHDHIVREQLRRFRGQEIRTTGDGFLASFDGPARAIRCAQAIRQATAAKGVPVRAGLHTGECERRGDDLGGLSVHIAARVAALAGAHEVLVSGTVRDLVAGSGIQFDGRGEHDLKGVPGSWKLFALSGMALDDNRATQGKLDGPAHSRDQQHADRRGSTFTTDDTITMVPAVLAGDAAGSLPSDTTAGTTSPLTPREQELLSLVAAGLTDQQIAEKLFISIRTVRSHLDRIRDKTSCRRRADLTRLAVETGLV